MHLLRPPFPATVTFPDCSSASTPFLPFRRRLPGGFLSGTSNPATSFPARPTSTSFPATTTRLAADKTFHPLTFKSFHQLAFERAGFLVLLTSVHHYQYSFERSFGHQHTRNQKLAFEEHGGGEHQIRQWRSIPVGTNSIHLLGISYFSSHKFS